MNNFNYGIKKFSQCDSTRNVIGPSKSPLFLLNNSFFNTSLVRHGGLETLENKTFVKDRNRTTYMCTMLTNFLYGMAILMDLLFIYLFIYF